MTLKNGEIFTHDLAAPPLHAVKPYQKPANGIIEIPNSARPLIEPLKERQKGPLRAKPYRILQHMTHICAGTHLNGAIDANGGFWLWGSNLVKDESYFTVGGPQVLNYQPKLVMTGIRSASVFDLHCLCVTETNQLWGRGFNDHFQLGLGDQTMRQEPAFIMDGIKSVFTNERQTYIIKQDDTLWAWGDNGYKTIPNGPSVCREPVYITDQVKSVTSNGEIALAVKTDGTLWAWGYNKYNLMFSREPFQTYPPTLLMSGVKTAAIQADRLGGLCMVVMENGDLYSLGTGDECTLVNCKLRFDVLGAPIKVMTGVADVKPGNNFALIRMEDGRLFATGENAVGQCGNGKASGYLKKPTSVMNYVIDMAVGYHHGLCLQENGDVWIWGADYGISKDAEL